MVRTPSAERTNLEVLKPQKWATSEECIKHIKGLLEEAEAGKIVSITYCCERVDNTFYSGASKTENKFGVAGNMMSMSMRLMGFRDES